MVSLMADMHLAEAYRQSGSPGQLPDSVRRNIGEAVLASHGVTQQQLDTTLAWYGRNIDDYYELFDKVDKELKRREKKAGVGVAQQDIGGNNIWPYPPHLYFDRGQSQQGLVFSLPNPAVGKGGILQWHVRYSKDGSNSAVLGVEYSDGTSSTHTSSSYGQRKMKLELITDTGKQVTRVFGILNVNRSQAPLWADSISLRVLDYDSMEYYKIRSQRDYRLVK